MAVSALARLCERMSVCFLSFLFFSMEQHATHCLLFQRHIDIMSYVAQQHTLTHVNYYVCVLYVFNVFSL